MSRKLRFKLRITRVKLNPEQAVLSCGCYSTGFTGEIVSIGTNLHSASMLGGTICSAPKSLWRPIGPVSDPCYEDPHWPSEINS